MEKVLFENTKLKRRIIMECGSITQFSKEMGLTKMAISNLLSGKSDWNRSKIMKAAKILNLNLDEELYDLFFLEK